MAIQKVKSTTVSEISENVSEDTPKTEEQVIEAEKTEQNTEVSQDVSNSEVTEEQVTNNTTTNNSTVKTVRTRMARTMARTMAAMAVAELEPAEENALIIRLTAGLQLKDSILIVSAVKSLQMSVEDVKSALETYADNVGGFLEEKAVIPADTGSIFNRLATGATIVDALLNYAAEKSYTADQTKELIVKYAQEGFPATLKYIESSTAAV